MTYFKKKSLICCSFHSLSVLIQVFKQNYFLLSQVCEYAIEVTNGNNPLHVIPMDNRLSLLQTWVAAKQMAQQQIAKTFGADDEVSQVIVK